MSDEQLARQIEMQKAFMPPGMPPMTPQMVRASYRQIEGMSDQQLQGLIDMQKRNMGSASPSS
jgi:hypothetical protein